MLGSTRKEENVPITKKLFVVFDDDTTPLGIHIEQCKVIEKSEFAISPNDPPSRMAPPQEALVVTKRGNPRRVRMGVDAADTYEIAFRLALQRCQQYFVDLSLQAIGDSEEMLKHEDDLEGPEDMYHKFATNAVRRDKTYEQIGSAMYALVANKLDYHVKRARRRLK